MPPAARKRTPAMQQFDRFKASHPDCVLFFRMGDFYEMFDDDAVLCHQVLGITLTERSPGTPMAGVPHHALEPYLRKLVEQGFRVAVCDQIQDPKDAKGVVDRAVTRVLTPGTLVDETLLDDGVTNVVAAILIQPPGGAGSGADRTAEPTGVFAACEISTGTFETCRLPLSRLLDEVMRIGPREVLFAGDPRAKEPDDASDELNSLREELTQRLAPVETFRPAWTFRGADAAEILTRHFGVAAVQGWGYEDDDPQIQVAGALLHYLIETQAPRAGEAGGTNATSSQAPAGARPLAHLMPPKSRDLGGHLIVDATSLASLEIERTIRGGQTTGALLSVMPTPRTPMGKRLIRDWLCFPLATIDAIAARQDMVQTLVDNVEFRERLQDELRAVQDVARINARIAMRRATPRDLCALGQSLAPARNIATCLAEHDAFARNAAALNAANMSLAPLAERLQRECVDTPPAHMRTGGLIRDGVDPELDEARSLQRDSAVWLADYQAELAETSGIPSLKTGYNKVFGYYIEITHAHRDKVPPAFHRKQTLKNAERYITPELKDYEEKVLTAESRAFAREQFLFDELCRLAAASGDACRTYADLIAEIDVLIAFARCQSERGWTRPTVTPERVIQIRDGRHPVLDRTLDGGFVPNDCSLDASGGRLALITGPNMAGKSTFIRQVALLTLLAHAGAWVPAASATIGLTDRIFTRIGASDELHAGRSTFMVEMTETANILHHATDRSLVILDEIGRGTSTLDGLALAWAITETVAERGARTLFATHYHELTELEQRLDGVTNLHVQVREWGDDIVFLHRIAKGRAGRSYGVHVARIAGVPPTTVERAREVLDSLAVHTSAADVPDSPGSRVKSRDDAGQLELFAEREHPLIEVMRNLNLDTLSPMDAFERLRDFKAMTGDDSADGAYDSPRATAPATAPASAPPNASTKTSTEPAS